MDAEKKKEPGSADAVVKDETVYLKEYVKSHPDNKMAWYLLGREYAQKGEQGKAVYCFQQAGEVYVAFENSLPQQVRLPDSLQPPQADFAVDTKIHSTFIGISKRRGVWVRGVIIAIWALLLLFLPFEPKEIMNLDNDPYIQSEVDTRARQNLRVPLEDMKVIYMTPDFVKQDQERLMKEIVFPKVSKALKTVAIQPVVSRGGGWIEWTKPPVYLFEAKRSVAAGNLNIQYLDPVSCACEPADVDVDEARSIYSQWQGQQEEWLVLQSALNAYRGSYGTTAKNLSMVVQNYPNNILSGVSPRMEEIYRQYYAPQHKDHGPESSKITGINLPAASPKAELQKSSLPFSQEQALKEPLEIIVDQTHHRLALVSGKVILRNYPVGLGKKKTPTPLGTFVISEKVKNPNGKTDGEFGSRGMTLSDTLYAIHGTNKPSSIGKDESHGCIRMLPADVEELFAMAPQGTKVTVQKNGLPEEVLRAATPFRIPATGLETNPKKIYKWLK